MKKAVMAIISFIVLLSVAMGYTLTINEESKVVTEEVSEGETVTIGLPDRSQVKYTVNQGNPVLRKLGNRCQIIMPAENVEITIEKVYVITFNSNGGNRVATKKMAAGEPYGTLPTPSKSGTTFAGWYSNSELTTEVTSTDTVPASDHTLYAKWTGNHTVTLDNQGATTAGTESVTATYGSEMPAITVPTKTDYTFGGYYTEANGGGTQYYNADGSSAKNWDKTAATTLYAYWIDAIPPETPEKPNLVDTYDTGSSSTDNITNLYSDLIIEGYAEAESTVTIYKDGVYESETVADENGYWSATVTNNQNVWTNWTVTATDAEESVSAESEALAIYSDTIVPIITDIETRYAAWTYPYHTFNYEVSPFWQTGIAESDPQIIFENLNLSDIEAVCIELGTEGISKDSSVAIFYSTGGSFTDENMVWNTISAGEYHLRYEIPTGSYTSIRVDIGDGGESYEISGMTFVAASGSSCSCMVNVLNANSDASGIWKYQKYSTLTNSWVDCTNWDQYDSPTEQWVAYRAIDRAGNEGTTSGTLHIVP